MLTLHDTLKFELYLEPTDMRKSFDSLSGIVKTELKANPTSVFSLSSLSLLILASVFGFLRLVRVSGKNKGVICRLAFYTDT
ncbi:hypothetical protein [Psychroflexus sp. MBR-150]|jgi:hypothetical protein